MISPIDLFVQASLSYRLATSSSLQGRKLYGRGEIKSFMFLIIMLETRCMVVGILGVLVSSGQGCDVVPLDHDYFYSIYLNLIWLC